MAKLNFCFFRYLIEESRKLHSHGRLIAARIDVLSFFFLKLRRSLSRRKARMRFCLRDIAQTRPSKKKWNRNIYSHGWDFNAMLAYNCNSHKSLARWDCVAVTLANSTRRKSFKYMERDSFKARLAGFDFAKASSCKITVKTSLVSFRIKSNHAWEFFASFWKASMHVCNQR